MKFAIIVDDNDEDRNYDTVLVCLDPGNVFSLNGKVMMKLTRRVQSDPNAVNLNTGEVYDISPREIVKIPTVIEI